MQPLSDNGSGKRDLKFLAYFAALAILPAVALLYRFLGRDPTRFRFLQLHQLPR